LLDVQVSSCFERLRSSSSSNPGRAATNQRIHFNRSYATNFEDEDEDENENEDDFRHERPAFLSGERERFSPRIVRLPLHFWGELLRGLNSPETQDGRMNEVTKPHFSIPSIIAIIAALVSFGTGAFWGTVLALVAIIFGVIGVLLSFAPGVRGGMVSTFSLLAGAVGIVVALIKALRSLF
jgi:hypothetical protein